MTPFALCALLVAGPGDAPPLRCLSWDAVPAECRHISRLVWFSRASKPEEVAAESRRRPVGRRALFSWDLHRDILDHPEDVCRDAAGQPTKHQGVWPEHGVAVNRERFARFFAAFKAAGGQMDSFILDFEGGYSNWHLGGQEKLERWLAIQNDPRFGALAAKLGFADLRTVCQWAGRRHYLKWNAVMSGVVDAALQRAIFEPAAEAFPGLLGSNYGSVVIGEEHAVPDLNGHLQWAESTLMGTHQAPSLYTWIGQLGDRKLDGRTAFGRTPFAGLLLSLNTLRASQRSSPKPIMPWIAWQRYTGDGPQAPPATVANTPYWRELVLHLALAGCDTFLFWNPHPWTRGQDPDTLSLPKDELLLDGIVDDLNRRLAARTRTPLTLQAMAWDSQVLLTGLRLDGRALWRATVPPGCRLIVTEPAGEREVALDEGGAGAWIETAADAPAPRLSARRP
jgi:hypothetical protein